MSRKCNKEGRDLIRYYEGLELTAYKDSVGVLTIGYGHTGSDVKEGMKITSDMAEDMLARDLAVFEYGVNHLLTGPAISDNAFSALVSFAFNLGLNNLKTSTLLKLVNLGRMEDAANEFLKWCRAGGKELPGLTARRRAERDLFLKPDTGAAQSGTAVPTSST